MNIPTDVAFERSSVISQDGTTIGYQSIGKGPDLLIIHGALSDSSHFTTLATELAGTYRVHMMDRRGRGMSGPQGLEYSMKKECEDVAAVQQATQAQMVFGHSYGGLVALETARLFNLFSSIALYEPGVVLQSQPEEWNWLLDYEKAIQKKDNRSAFAHFVQGAGHSPLSKLPLWYAKLMLRLFIRGEHWRGLEALLQQNLLEHKEVKRLAETYHHYQHLQAEVLLAYGGKSPQAVKDMIHTLNNTIAKSEVIEIPQLEHLSPENRYEPLKVAALIKPFFNR
ncbi:alpha/beta hydrolase [Paenibacillus lupini]|uniref:alpha/beta fold hydrolase n=1 Tax=Paenibacillus lupini TaxID=1450204 RepID=UPI00141F1CE7|nr:alpha/beta hydrolase [Paenibacillus lupini]NIK21196.1 pimeloyl-ACP methyl ester carboxylesterase [Paenibacillus lupini]